MVASRHEDVAALGDGEQTDPDRARFIDPLERLLAQQRPLSTKTVVQSSPVPHTMEGLVRRCQVHVEGKSGRVRLELGSGEFEGSVVELSYDAGAGELRVDVDVGEAGEGALEAWRTLAERLRERGLPLTAFEIRSDAGLSRSGP